MNKGSESLMKVYTDHSYVYDILVLRKHYHK